MPWGSRDQSCQLARWLWALACPRSHCLIRGDCSGKQGHSAATQDPPPSLPFRHLCHKDRLLHLCPLWETAQCGHTCCSILGQHRRGLLRGPQSHPFLPSNRTAPGREPGAAQSWTDLPAGPGPSTPKSRPTDSPSSLRLEMCRPFSGPRPAPPLDPDPPGQVSCSPPSTAPTIFNSLLDCVHQLQIHDYFSFLMS